MQNKLHSVKYGSAIKATNKSGQPRIDLNIRDALAKIERQRIEIEMQKEEWNFFKNSEDIDEALEKMAASEDDISDEEIGDDDSLDSDSPDDIISKYKRYFLVFIILTIAVHFLELEEEFHRG